MKVFLTICLLVLSATVELRAQQSTPRSGLTAVGRERQRRTLTRAQTREAEQRLAQMGYWTGPVDGVFDPATRSALVAFQKWQGRPITGQLTIDLLYALRASADSRVSQTWPKAREAGYAHVEVDLDRQVLIVVNDRDDVRVLPVSTGNGKNFVEDGQTSIAYTPRGRFIVYDQSAGWEKGYFGSMYYANYISGGVAIHGHPNVPSEPASHGCIRIPMFAAREMSKLLALGTIVLVYDKLSFVSARDWAANPQLKQAALSSYAFKDESEHSNYPLPLRPKSRSHRGD